MHEPRDPDEFPNFLITLRQHALIDYNTHKWSRDGNFFKPRSWSTHMDYYWVPAKRSTCSTGYCPFKWIYDHTLVEESPVLMDMEMTSDKECLVFNPMTNDKDFTVENGSWPCDSPFYRSRAWLNKRFFLLIKFSSYLL